MYPYYSKWIRSHRDLPLRLNQWNSVVRWEFKHPQPFLRTREFLWQEGHTAHMRLEQANEEVMQILEWYQGIYKDILAVPTIPGKKTEKEKFAGGLYTTTCEGYIPATGRGIQGATSHCLGQNFSKMFNISVEDPAWKAGDSEESKKLFVWQNSWGLSTRVIGVMVMVHGDNKGLVLPPGAAQFQVVIVPCGITAKTTDEQRKKLLDAVYDLEKGLKDAGIRARADTRETYSPGYKFNDWELKGVPLRLEYGPKDIEKKEVVTVRRDTGIKQSIKLENVSITISKMLATMHLDMYNKAKKAFDDHTKLITNWDDVVPALDSKNVILIAHCKHSRLIRGRWHADETQATTGSARTRLRIDPRVTSMSTLPRTTGHHPWVPRVCVFRSTSQPGRTRLCRALPSVCSVGRMLRYVLNRSRGVGTLLTIGCAALHSFRAVLLG